jgi:predicted nucleic acid-binding protein
MEYLDTSVLIAALTPGPATHEVQDWLARQAPDDLCVSDWVITEFHSALSIKVRTGQLDLADRAEVLATFRQLIEESFRVLPVERSDFMNAALFTEQTETGLRAGDALHLAVALSSGARLCALDRTLLDAAPRFGVPVGVPG